VTKKYIVSFVDFIFAPLRYVIRSEVKRILKLRDQDIGVTLQRRANESTTDYINEHMGEVDSLASSYDVLAKALSYAKLGEDKLVCEFGVFTGNSINYIASKIQGIVFGFDSFEGLPERWRDGFVAGFFSVDKLPQVLDNVVLIKGLFDDSLPKFVNDHKGNVAFLHIDCDLYSSTKTIFRYLGSRIESGTVIVFDEYFNYPGWQNGEIKAFHEFIAETGLQYEYIGYNRLHEQVAVRII